MHCVAKVEHDLLLCFTSPPPLTAIFDVALLCAFLRDAHVPRMHRLSVTWCPGAPVPRALAPRSRTKSSQDDKPFQPDQGLWPPLSNILLLFAGYEV